MYLHLCLPVEQLSNEYSGVLLQRLEVERDSALKQLLCKHQEGVRRQAELSEAKFAAEGTSRVRRHSACLSITFLSKLSVLHLTNKAY